MSKKATKVEPVIGRHYANSCNEYVRVDSLENGIPYGVSIHSWKGFVCVSENTSLDMFFSVFDEKGNDEFEINEISPREFNEELKGTQGELERICNQIKKSIK